MTAPLKAPFPYFGGKRTMASEVWRRFGTPKQYSSRSAGRRRCCCRRRRLPAWKWSAT
jgi:hypothetical protein